MQATWNGTVIAASDDIVTVEGNAYFPAEALVEGCFRPLVAASLADQHPPEAQQNRRARTHWAGGEGGHQRQVAPVAAAAGVADALGFPVAGGVAALHPLVVAPGHHGAILPGEHGPHGDAPFTPAEFRLGAGLGHQQFHRLAFHPVAFRG